jgi:hypothetical protein
MANQVLQRDIDLNGYQILTDTGATTVADWDAATTRYFMISPNGDDANKGWNDGTILGSVAVKTWARLLKLLPNTGDSRSAAIIAEAGSYDEAVNFSYFTGYSNLWIRGTSTNSTAGATSFSGDTADRLGGGFVQVAGTKSTGYYCAYSDKAVFTVVATSGYDIVVTCVAHGFVTGDKILIEGVVGVNCNGCHTITKQTNDTFTLNNTTAGYGTYVSGGQARRWKITAVDSNPVSFTDDDSGQSFTGYRMRFDVATPTSLLRNASAAIWAVGTDTIIPGSNFRSGTGAGQESCAANDVFYIEQPGVVLNALSFIGCTFGSTQVAGIDAATLTVSRLTGALTFCGVNSRGNVVYSMSQNIVETGMYIDEMAGSTNYNVGVIQKGDVSKQVSNVAYYQSYGSTLDSSSNSQILLSACTSFLISGGYSRRGIYLTGSGMGGADVSLSGVVKTIGSGKRPDVVGAVRDFRVNNCPSNTAGIEVNSSSVCIYGVDVTGQNNGYFSACSVAGHNSSAQFRGATGCRNNANYGIAFAETIANDRMGAVNCSILVNKTLTPDIGSWGITGTKGHVRMQNAVSSYVNLEASTLDYYKGVSGDFGNQLVALMEDADTVPTVRNALSEQDTYLTDSSAPVVPFQLVRLSSADKVVAAQADTAAHATMVLGVSVNRADNTVPTAVLIARGKRAWVRFDVSQGAPTVGNIVYLSTDYAGKAQAGIPSVTGTNQKLRIGRVVRLHWSDNSLALVDMKVESFPINADGKF